MRTTITSAAIAAMLLAGCGEQKPDPRLTVRQERRMAEMKARQEEMMRLAETPDPGAELDEALEAAATEIEAAFASAQALVNESKTNGGSGNCTKKEQVSGVSGSATGGKAITLTKTFSVQNPDGTEWHAVIEKKNGVVTKAKREEGAASSEEQGMSEEF